MTDYLPGTAGLIEEIDKKHLVSKFKSSETISFGEKIGRTERNRSHAVSSKLVYGVNFSDNDYFFLNPFLLLEDIIMILNFFYFHECVKLYFDHFFSKKYRNFKNSVSQKIYRK